MGLTAVANKRQFQLRDPKAIKTIEPDIAIAKQDLLIEVKGVAIGGDLKLADTQVKKYVEWQSGKHTFKDFRPESPVGSPRVDFWVYRHGIKNLCSEYQRQSISKLVEDLSQATFSLTILPMSIIWAIQQRTDHSDKRTSRYTGQYWPWTTRLNAGGLNDLFTKPEETLLAIGIDPKDFSIKKRRFPEGIKMSGYEINPFPILRIQDIDYQRWIRQLEQISIKPKEKKPKIKDDDLDDLLF